MSLDELKPPVKVSFTVYFPSSKKKPQHFMYEGFEKGEYLDKLKKGLLKSNRNRTGYLSYGDAGGCF